METDEINQREMARLLKARQQLARRLLVWDLVTWFVFWPLMGVVCGLAMAYTVAALLGYGG